MDLFKLSESFWEEHQRNPLSKTAIALYFYLLHVANKRFWKLPMHLSWNYLQLSLNCSRDSLGRAISDLKSRNLIVYENKKKKAWFDFQTNNQTNNNRFDNQIKNQTNNNRFDNQTQNQTNSIKNKDKFDNQTQNQTKSQTNNQTNNPTERTITSVNSCNPQSSLKHKTLNIKHNRSFERENVYKFFRENFKDSEKIIKRLKHENALGDYFEEFIDYLVFGKKAGDLIKNANNPIGYIIHISKAQWSYFQEWRSNRDKREVSDAAKAI